MPITVSFPADTLQDALNADPEFRLSSRYWDGVLELRVGDDRCVVSLVQGEVVSVSGQAPSGAPEPVVITAPAEDWARLLEPAPKPFYQDFHAASAHHGFRLGGDVETLWAYYAAVRRTADILRAVAVVEGS